MKKLGLIISALALVLGLSQCRRPNAPIVNSGERINQHVTLSALYGDQNDNSKVSLLSLTSELKLKWDGDETIYVYDGTGMCGTLAFAEFIDENHTSAKFEGDINPVAGSMLNFYYFNNVASENVPGIGGTTGTLVRDYETQDGSAIDNVISNFVLVNEEPVAISSSGNYNVSLGIPFSVVNVKLKDFGSGDVTVKGMASTGFSINEKGVLTYNEKTSVTLTAPGTDRFFAVLMPKASTKYTFRSASGIAEMTWEILKNKYYTKLGSTSGESVLVEARPFADAPTVATNTKCLACQYKRENMGGVVTSATEQICEFGMVYAKGKDSNPVIDDGVSTKIVAGTATVNGDYQFSYDLEDKGLEKGATYAMRAYAIGENGTAAYGDVKTFVAGDEPLNLPTSWTNGVNPAEFKVSATKKVRFSQGNLRYSASGTHAVAGSEIPVAGTWSFHAHQFDFIGASQGTEATDVDRDLLGWGTSGWNNGNINYMPYSVAGNDYNPSPENQGWGYGPKKNSTYTNSLTGDYANADWGVYNAISNGGDEPGLWRTLTNAEWGYLINTRTNHAQLRGFATIADCTHGMVVLPDTWTTPEGVPTFHPGWGNGWATNEYTYAQWSLMEAAGALLLPASGERRNVTNIGNFGVIGRYWSTTYKNASQSHTFIFQTSGAEPEVKPQDNQARYWGFAVRLVQDVN